MNEYRVNLDIYNGPLDLLLYLIRREEVDIYDIPIARITGQYVKYVELLKDLDPNLAGEFLVLASTLLEIKTRMLLPKPPPEEASEDGLEIDPRAELVRQLLEYKAFKDAADDLRTAAKYRAKRFERRPGHVEPEEKQLELEDVQIWDLFDAFSGMMEAIGRQVGEHQVIYDDTPIELHATDLLDRLQRDGPLTFRQVFEGRNDRGEVVGLFLALLELIRQKLILASQDLNFGDIRIRLNPSPTKESGNEDEPSAAGAKNGDAEEAGQYISDAPPEDQDDSTDTDDEGNVVGT